MNQFSSFARPIVSLLLAVFLTIGITFSSFAEIRDADEYFFHQSFGDLMEEVEIAQEEGKEFIFIMFELMQGCPWCIRMKNEVLNRSEVQDFYREKFRVLNFSVVGDDIVTFFDGNDYSEKELAQDQLRLRASPEFLFYDLKGKQVVRYTGAVKNPEEFLLLGEFVANREFEKTNFRTYKREKLN